MYESYMHIRLCTVKQAILCPPNEICIFCVSLIDCYSRLKFLLCRSKILLLKLLYILTEISALSFERNYEGKIFVIFPSTLILDFHYLEQNSSWVIAPILMTESVLRWIKFVTVFINVKEARLQEINVLYVLEPCRV